MKRCPTCDKTFDDNMRFCQSDGTPLVEDAPVDPYKTMVARPEDFAAFIPAVEPEPPVAAPPMKEEEEVLQIPEASDPLKTMYASEDEIRRAMESKDADEQVIEIPPLVEPEPPKFIEPGLSPPPSPFSQPEGSRPPESTFSATTPPIPSPFTDQKPASYQPPPAAFEPPAPEPPRFTEPEPAFNPFNEPAPEVKAPMVQAEWTPPPAPNAAWQNQDVGQNTPFQPPAAGTSGPSSMLAIISLALGAIGILSVIPTLLFILCGVLPFFLGIAAVITGFLARSRAKSNPEQYGGGGLALFGLILGILDVLAPFGVVLLTILLWGGLAALGNLGR